MASFPLKAVLVFLAAAVLGGCASEVVRHSSAMSASSAPRSAVTVAAIDFRLDSGYSRSIPKGTEFVEIGAIAEGRVWKPTNTVFTIEGAHMHEAYPVTRDGRLVGFYLPVEQAYSPLSHPVTLEIQGKPTK